MSIIEEFRKRPLYGAVFLIGFTNFVVVSLIGINRTRFALPYEDPVHTYPIRFRGGTTYFFTQTLGRYLVWSFVAHFVLLGLLGVIAWYYSRRERNAV